MCLCVLPQHSPSCAVRWSFFFKGHEAKVYKDKRSRQGRFVSPIVFTLGTFISRVEGLRQGRLISPSLWSRDVYISGSVDKALEKKKKKSQISKVFSWFYSIIEVRRRNRSS